MLLHNQAWVGWVKVHGGTRALAGRADQGSPSLGLGGLACSLLAWHCIQGWIDCQDRWRDIHQQGRLPSCLVVVPVGSLQPVVDSPLPVEDSLLPVEDSHQVEGDSHQIEEDSLLPVEGSLQLGEGKLQAEVGRHQVVEGKPQAVVGIRLPEGGIQGSSWFSLLGVSSWRTYLFDQPQQP